MRYRPANTPPPPRFGMAGCRGWIGISFDGLNEKPTVEPWAFGNAILPRCRRLRDVLAAALLVLLSAAAGAGVVAADFLGFANDGFDRRCDGFAAFAGLGVLLLALDRPDRLEVFGHAITPGL